MKKIFLAPLFVVLVFGLFLQELSAENRYAIPEKVAAKMQKYSWREGCPIPLAELSYLQIPYWGFDHKEHQGELIVHQSIAQETKQLFAELFQQKFQIQRMKLVDAYKGSDDASMAANNSSAFNCRSVTNHPGVFSKHSYGKAVDINPLINPYVTQKEVQPKAGKKYTDRNKVLPGMIVKNDAIYRAFIKNGWQWGGDWKSLKDYQHFEKK